MNIEERKKKQAKISESAFHKITTDFPNHGNEFSIQMQKAYWSPERSAQEGLHSQVHITIKSPERIKTAREKPKIIYKDKSNGIMAFFFFYRNKNLEGNGVMHFKS